KPGISVALLDGRMCHDPVGDCVCHDLARGRELQRWPEHQSCMSDRWLGQPPPVNNNITRHFLAAEQIDIDKHFVCVCVCVCFEGEGGMQIALRCSQLTFDLGGGAQVIYRAPLFSPLSRYHSLVSRTVPPPRPPLGGLEGEVLSVTVCD